MSVLKRHKLKTVKIELKVKSLQKKKGELYENIWH